MQYSKVIGEGYQIAVMGASRVGKSAIVKQFTQHIFPE